MKSDLAFCLGSLIEKTNSDGFTTRLSGSNKKQTLYVKLLCKFGLDDYSSLCGKGEQKKKKNL